MKMLKKMMALGMMVVIALVFTVAWNDAQLKKTIPYELKAQVVELDGKLVTVIDENGEAWDFFGDGVSVGDEIIMMINDNGTEEIYDDEIIDFR